MVVPPRPDFAYHSCPGWCRLASGQGAEALEQHRESSLKYQTRSLAVYTDGRGYALGSVEGRVAMEFFDAADAQARRR